MSSSIQKHSLSTFSFKSPNNIQNIKYKINNSLYHKEKSNKSIPNITSPSDSTLNNSKYHHYRPLSYITYKTDNTDITNNLKIRPFTSISLFNHMKTQKIQKIENTLKSEKSENSQKLSKIHKNNEKFSHNHDKNYEKRRIFCKLRHLINKSSINNICDKFIESNDAFNKKVVSTAENIINPFNLLHIPKTSVKIKENHTFYNKKVYQYSNYVKNYIITDKEISKNLHNIMYFLKKHLTKEEILVIKSDFGYFFNNKHVVFRIKSSLKSIFNGVGMSLYEKIRKEEKKEFSQNVKDKKKTCLSFGKDENKEIPFKDKKKEQILLKIMKSMKTVIPKTYPSNNKIDKDYANTNTYNYTKINENKKHVSNQSLDLVLKLEKISQSSSDSSSSSKSDASVKSVIRNIKQTVKSKYRNDNKEAERLFYLLSNRKIEKYEKEFKNYSLKKVGLLNSTNKMRIINIKNEAIFEKKSFFEEGKGVN